MVWFEFVPVAFIAVLGLVVLYAISTGQARQ
jgi:hypothetical protein